MLYSDRPIRTPDEDQLGRSEFANSLSKSIYNLKIANEGFVIGVKGEWGSGKSSVIELVLRTLTNLDILDRIKQKHSFTCDFDQVEHIARLYSRIESNIAITKFQSLNTELWERNHRKSTFRALFETEADAENAELYYQVLQETQSNPRNLIIRFSPWLIPSSAELSSALLSDMARGIGSKFGSEIAASFAGLVARLAEVSSVLGSAIDLVSPISAGKLLSGTIDFSDKLMRRLNVGPTLEEARIKLRSDLERLAGRKIIVVLDDLDRLSPNEAVDIVSVVKGLGDLPNVIYILSYDGEKLAELIGRSLEIDGSEFLQKIIQYEVNLPRCDKADLRRLMSRDIVTLLQDPDDLDVRARLAEAWEYVIRPYIRTPRDIKRLMNAYYVSSAALRDSTDPIDLLIVETFRVFDSQTYQWIREHLEAVVQ